VLRKIFGTKWEEDAGGCRGVLRKRHVFMYIRFYDAVLTAQFMSRKIQYDMVRMIDV